MGGGVLVEGVLVEGVLVVGVWRWCERRAGVWVGAYGRVRARAVLSARCSSVSPSDTCEAACHCILFYVR